MVSIFNLFSKSPFGPIQRHMQLVHECVEALGKLLDAFTGEEGKDLESLASEVCELERKADVVKNDIRDTLPKSIFMPVDRRDLLEVVSNIDDIADTAEDVARLIALRKKPIPNQLKERFREFTGFVFSTEKMANEVVAKLDNLLASSFAGVEADRALDRIRLLGEEERNSDIAQETLLTELFELEDQFKPFDLYWWLKIFGKIGTIADKSQRMVNRLRLFMSK
jgi:predicted phosphate transport protein (TIGR00153 family)